uniref:TIMELESS-interacting protein n=1 Tax=Tetranychus urticae TaxID=32264 RepID=T1L5K6_TETUR
MSYLWGRLFKEFKDERPSKKKKSKGEKVKRKRAPEDDEDGDPDKQNDEYVEEDGWLVNDLGDDGYAGYEEEDDEEDDDDDGDQERPKVFGEDEAEEVDDVSGKPKKPKNDEKEEKEKKKRRIIHKGPRVTLNVDRLKHFNALPVLPGILRKMKFKGKGYEEDDLALIMITMEQWAHRVMPNMKFDDFIEKVEQLGSKKILKTFVAKMRYNMTLDVRGNVPGKDFDRDTDEEMLFDEELPPMPTVNAEDAFDALMKEAELVVKQRAAASSSVSNVTNGNTINPPMVPSVNNSQPTASSQNTSSQNKSSSLTEEQRRKIAENARKAAEKRLSIAMEKTKKQELEKSLTQ